MTIKKLLDERGIITPEAMASLQAKSPNVSCECPDHLIKILEAVKEFTTYQENCIIEKPSDELTHQWLKSTSVNLEHLLSNTIVSLARMEGMIDDDNQIAD